MTRIVTTHHRYKRPPKKRKAVATAGPVIVRQNAKSLRVFPGGAPEQPANDDRKPAIVRAKRSAIHKGLEEPRKSAIITTKSRKRVKLKRAERRAAEPALTECSAGHKIAFLVQNTKFEMLLESGATALLEGFTLEACSGFYSALERFYEFALRVICHARGMCDENGNLSEVFAKTFAGMSRQSERQLGAFMLLHAMEFDEPYVPPSNLVAFRNNVIHKGEIPTLAEAQKFCGDVYTVIASMFVKLKAKYPGIITSRPWSRRVS